MNNDRAVYESLLRLAKRLELGDTELPAICRWLIDDTGIPAGYLQQVVFPPFFTWEKFSGDPYHPVNGSMHQNPKDLYCKVAHRPSGYWDLTTQYGTNRRELLIHLIHHLLLKIHADEEAQANIRINL